MRLNKFLALHATLSRRSADSAIQDGRVSVNGTPATVGQSVTEDDQVTLDGKPVQSSTKKFTIIFHKPVGFVCSRNGQGSKTIYELLPPALHNLKSVGRLDKDSSGLLLLTNDGDLAYSLTHPRFRKFKQYEVTLDQPLTSDHLKRITVRGVLLEDGISQLQLEPRDSIGKQWHVRMSEGRNRQIRRTFAAVGCTVTALHRTNLGPYSLGSLKPGEYAQIPHHAISL